MRSEQRGQMPGSRAAQLSTTPWCGTPEHARQNPTMTAPFNVCARTTLTSPAPSQMPIGCSKAWSHARPAAKGTSRSSTDREVLDKGATESDGYAPPRENPSVPSRALRHERGRNNDDTPGAKVTISGTARIAAAGHVVDQSAVGPLALDVRSPFMSSSGMVEYWFPYVGHPDGESKVAWFRVHDGHGFRAPGNPAGQSDAPCFSVVDGWAYPCLSMPGDRPTFQIIGSFVYTPTGTAWFRIRRGADGPAPQDVRDRRL